MTLSIKPAANLVFGLVLLLITAIGNVFHSGFGIVFYLMIVTISLLSMYDLFLLYRRQPPQVCRLISHTMPVANWCKVELTVDYSTRGRYFLSIFDHVPEQSVFDCLPARLILEGDDRHYSYHYRVRPVQRGVLEFGRIDCLYRSRLGLWYRRYRSGVKQEIQVYPDYKPMLEYALLATENRVSAMGIFKQRKRGQGMDFHQLREFRDGDTLKQVDWKASSRMRKIIAREYQEERDQEIIFLVDCGHRMLSRDNELSQFDYILNSVLLMAYVALRQGDAVGLATFGQNRPRWIKPVKGVSRLNHILSGIYDLQPDTGAPDYISGANFILGKHRKRALVIILTNLRDDDSEEIQLAVQLLNKQHRVVVASMRESAIDLLLKRTVDTLDDALTISAAQGYLVNRNRLIQLLKRKRIHTVDVPPEELPLALTNTYLDLKVSGQI